MTFSNERLIAWNNHVDDCRQSNITPVSWETFKRLIRRGTDEGLIDAVCQAHVIARKNHQPRLLTIGLRK